MLLHQLDSQVPLGTAPCQRCALSAKITNLLSGGTGSITDGLASLHQALMAVERRATVWHWPELPRVRTLLAALGRDHRPLTHEILDGLRESNTLKHLRSILVATGGAACPGRAAGASRALDDPGYRRPRCR